MEKITHFVGIDVSKETLDVALVNKGKTLEYFKIKNNQKQILKLINTLKKKYDFKLYNMLICAEYTGIYNNHLLALSEQRDLNTCLEAPAQIKRSLGMHRGKNDKVDANRIAHYAYKNREYLKLWKPERIELKKLKQLNVIRNRIVKTITNLKKPLSETSFFSKEEKTIIQNSYKNSLKALEKDLSNIESEIIKLIREDEYLNHLFKIVSSVKGIGKITAIKIIIASKEFKAINDPKKFACFAGVVPFEHQSGSSIKGRNRVSNMADKSLKSTLHMAALSASRYPGELRDYYLRKVDEGKNKMSVINAVRNKLIHRVFACVKNNTLYEENYVNKLV